MNDVLSQNPYAAPGSALQEQPDQAAVPTIAEALARRYDFQIGALMSEAWALVSGTKGIIIGGLVVMYVALWALMSLLSMLGMVGFAGVMGIGMLGGGASSGVALLALVFGFLVFTLLSTAIAYPFMAGITMVGIRRAAGQPVRFNELFNHFGRTVPVIVAALLMTLLTVIGYLLFVIPGIYLALSYVLAIPLVVERGLSPWQAMEASRKAIGQHWFKVLGLFLVVSVVMMVSAIPFGIGLIWTFPFAVLTLGVLYRIIFGVLPAPR